MGKQHLVSRSGRGLVMACLLLGEAFYLAISRSEDFWTLAGDLMLLFWAAWCAAAIYAAALALRRWDRWGGAALLALALGLLRMSAVDASAEERAHWNRLKPELDRRRLAEAKTPMQGPATDWGWRSLERPGNLRLLQDSLSHRRFAFVRYRSWMESGMAYVYDPTELGDHWYRCIIR